MRRPYDILLARDVRPGGMKEKARLAPQFGGAGETP